MGLPEMARRRHDPFGPSVVSRPPGHNRRQWMYPVSSMLVAVATATVGCSDGAAGPGTTSPPATILATTSATATTASVGTITLVRSGGITGATSTITLTADGELTITSNERAKGVRSTSRVAIAPGDLDRLHKLVASPEFAALADNYIPAEGACCDLFMYELSVELGTETKSTTTATGLDEPAVLTQVITLLESMKPA
jgi:hypothetical protein